MKIAHLIRKDFLIINPFNGLNAVKKKLLERTVLVVQDESQFYGILTMNDIVSNPEILVIDCLSIKKLVDSEQSVQEVISEMNTVNTDVLPVGEDGNFIGLVFKNELYKYLSEYNLELETDIQERTLALKKYWRPKI